MNTPPPPWEPLRKGLDEAVIEGFNKNYKVNEKLIYFYYLSVNTTIARLLSAMIAKTAFIAVGGPP